MLGFHPQNYANTSMATKRIGASLQSINAQIAALQVKADAIRKREVGEVVAKIKDAIAHYGLTAADLGLGTSASKTSKAASTVKRGRKPGSKVAGAMRRVKTARPAKYTDGQGRTWSGIGKRPDWFKAALAEGREPKELLVKA